MNNSKERIAFVCQRYGLEVNGGAEQYCYELAERLSDLYDVTVYTTCALDYTSWENSYEPGSEDIHGVHVRRYPVAKTRSRFRFGAISARVMNGRKHTDVQEEKWIDAQGPYCPAALEELAKEHAQYRAVFFMTYLYYPTVKGLQMGFENAVLIPTVHDEPPVYLRCYDKVFAAAKAFAWNTPEERAFAIDRFPFIKTMPSEMTGIGIERPTGNLPELPESIRNAAYLVYAGRIDKNKGCEEMFSYFQRYKREQGGELKLVLMGKPVLDIPKDPDIIHLGFVSEEMKFAVMEQSLALVLFSHFESLSMVVLESMIMGRPVLVAGQCEVLKGHCVRSNAGFYFYNYHEFAAEIDYLQNHPVEYEAMRSNGKKYVEQNYQWDVIVQKYIKLIQLFPAEHN